MKTTFATGLPLRKSIIPSRGRSSQWVRLRLSSRVVISGLGTVFLLGLFADRDTANSSKSLADVQAPRASRREAAGTSFIRRSIRKRRAHGEKSAGVKWLSSSELYTRVTKRQPIHWPEIFKKNDLQGVATIQVLIDRSGRVVSARAVSGNPLSTAATVRSVRGWTFEPYRTNGNLQLMAGILSVKYDFQDDDRSDCAAKFDQALTYEMKDDPRAEQEFRRALSDGGERCPEGLLTFSQHLSGNLRFGEAAKTLQDYINLTPAEDRRYDEMDVRALRSAARLKERVDRSNAPSLDDLLNLIREVSGYGRHHGDDAIPYAEKAVELYPSSGKALMNLAFLLSHKQNGSRKEEDDRAERLLNRAALMELENAEVYTARGFFYYWRRRLAEAEQDFERALSLSGGASDQAWKGLGFSLMDKGEKHQAAIAFRNYLRLTNDVTEVTADVRMRLERLEKSR